MFCAPFFVEATCYDWCRWLLYKKGCWQVWLLSCNSCVNWRLWKLCRHYQHHVFSFTVHCFLIAMGINLYLEMVNNIAWNYLRMLISRKWYLLFIYATYLIKQKDYRYTLQIFICPCSFFFFTGPVKYVVQNQNLANENLWSWKIIVL